MLRAQSRQATYRARGYKRETYGATIELQREKTHEDKGKRNSHKSARLLNALHSSGKVPVRKLVARPLSMVFCGEKARKAGASSRVNKIISKNPRTPIPHDKAERP